VSDTINVLDSTSQPDNGPVPPGHQVNPLLTVHRMLRGRYHWALALGLLLSIPGGLGGYHAIRPMYTSTAIVRVAPTMPKILRKTEENQLPPLFESFVSAQASFLSSRRVLDLAVADEAVVQAGWPAQPAGIALLAKRLEVNNRRGTELIMASVNHEDPVLAQKAVNAVLKAYDSVQDELSGMTITDREQALVQRQRDLQRDLDLLRGQLSDLSMVHGTDDVNQLRDAKVQEMIRLDNMIASITFQLAGAEAAAIGVTPEAPANNKVSHDDLAQGDPTLRGLLDQALLIKTALDTKSRLLSPAHREIKDLQRSYDEHLAKIEERAAFLLGGGVTSTVEPGLPGGPVKSPEQLRVLLNDATRRRDLIKTDAIALDKTGTAILALKERLEGVKKDMDETTQRIDEIRLETRGSSAGRVTIIQRGDLPIEPSTDRRIPLAVGGACAGLGIGMGVLVLFGLLKGGYRYIDELDSAEVPVSLLGTVPDLSGDDLDHESMAALSVHHLRNMLEVQTGGRLAEGRVFTITSASAGDGKTSVAIALAMSFAASGSRTVLVDADLVGRGSTKQLNLSSSKGVCEATMHGATNGTAHGEVQETMTSRLWALPAGQVHGVVPEHLSPTSMGRLIRGLRQRFETVVIDTGPILGSLEANIVAPLSDRVVVVVSRGQGPKVVRASILRLQRLGATCAGLVFNRATVHDFDRSVSTASVSARSIRDLPTGRSRSAAGRMALLRAVSTPKTNDAPQHAE